MSEQLEMASVATSEDSENWSDWVRKGRLASFLDVSEKTIETRVNSGEYQSQKRKGKAYIRIPKSSDEFRSLPKGYSDESQSESEAPQKSSETNFRQPPTTSDNYSEVVAEALRKMAQLSERVMEQSEELIKTKTELEQKKSELVIMNNERANYNTSLQRHKDADRELTHYKGETEALRREVEALRIENEKLKAKGWLGRLIGR